jgi:hypothetical protein
MNQLNAHVDSRPFTVSHHTSVRQHCSTVGAGKEISRGRKRIIGVKLYRSKISVSVCVK